MFAHSNSRITILYVSLTRANCFFSGTGVRNSLLLHPLIDVDIRSDVNYVTIFIFTRRCNSLFIDKS